MGGSSYHRFGEDNTKSVLTCEFKKVLVLSVSLFFVLMSGALFISLFIVKVPLPDITETTRVVGTIQTLQIPIHEVLEQVDQIAKSMRRSNVLGQIIGEIVNTTLLSVQNNEITDKELVVQFEAFLDGFSVFLEKLNDSIFKRFVPDSLVSEVRELADKIKEMNPILIELYGKMTEINSNFKGFFSVFDIIQKKMSVLLYKTPQIEKMFNNLNIALDMGNEKAKMIVDMWNLSSVVFSIVCGFIFFSSLYIGYFSWFNLF
ncbi:hypothetical protein EIN_498100 [Entamoeba invadens IP1]|uniref:Uncharacterized protein n=1 Tax=Entamoeba invadens IP1 TaxID=370355 RepID=A0A0A1UG88_ENTIV|nr:hypothetical protein EIN_498100 [Entamoeba invadens IP1]ELP94620.1 hypothetical protein EIN_498100 [Entamoeba invadens IP1]|eukprot:XP_004261391.1 hypothetical protein EIN_498100 [Entamoeba invadens IP1]